MKISIKNLDKAAVLVALYNAARTQGMGSSRYDPAPLTLDEANTITTQNGYRFDYLKGRIMKVDVEGDEFDPRLYDRDNGAGAAQRAIDQLRA